ncbi:hypothetical protein TNCV_4307851 [Trichonephila clavipes]|nr:hypothetical protein TNCV_4307851 [Trichonephila clavipes]
MACDTEGGGFQMLNDDEIVTSMQEESDPVNNETVEDEDNNDESSKGPSKADVCFLRLRQLWSDYFLWGYVKSLVYADKPQTPDHLEDNICRVIADIRPQMLEKVIENCTSRLDYIRASRGSPMPEIIFKM